VFLKAIISEVAGPNVTLIETGSAVARQLARVLGERGLTASAESSYTEQFWTSGDPVESRRVMSALLERDVRVEKLPDL
jgi:glutamate racemase